MPRNHDRKISFLGLPVYARKCKLERLGRYTIIHQLLGGAAQLTKYDDGRLRLSLFGVSVFVHGLTKTKILGINVYKHGHTEKWLDKIQSHTDKEYDDIYLIRHNIGEAYVELLHLGDAIKANKSRKPLLVLWDKKYDGFYKMFLPEGMDMRYIDLSQRDIQLIFDEETIIKHDGRRFICTTPQIVPNMKKLMITQPDVNFYDYINDAAGVKKGAKPALPKPSAEARWRVKSKIERMGLDNNFVILCPEALSLAELNDGFWEILAEGLRKRGYDIFVNAYDKDMALKNVKSARMTIEEIFVLAGQSKGIISLGSGLAVFLTSAGVKMDLLYTDFNNRKVDDSSLVMQIYSVHHLPGVSSELVKEYDTNKIKDEELINAILQRY